MTHQPLRRLLRLDLVAVAVLSATSAYGAGKLQVSPEKVSLPSVGWTQQILVTQTVGKLAKDRTRAAKYTSSNPAVATVSQTGLVRGHKPGSATIQIIDSHGRSSLLVQVGNRQPKVYFRRDVVPLLTKLGCNSGGCHGKATGQNGFKLSLLGFEPDFDFGTLVKEARGRRISIASPASSLLLTKATAVVPHGGGRRLAQDSDDYRVLRAWIENGARASTPQEPKLERIAVTPNRRVLSPQDTQQVRVMAFYSDGSSRDVTRQALYQTNEPKLATVDATGWIEVQKQSGLFAIMARYGGQIDVAHVAVPYKRSPTDKLPADVPSLAQLDKRLQGKTDRRLLRVWQQLDVTPSREASDETFIRRVTLDICGLLPTSGEVRTYVADKNKDKRQRLINRLLDRPEYAAYFSLKWADILRNRGRGYSTSKQRPGTALFRGWIRDAIAANKPYDQFVADIITASGSQAENPPTVWYRQVRTTQDYVESIAQAFLGVRIQCAQCHHHPFERWSQADYYGLAAVFARVGRKGGFADAEVPTNETIFLASRGAVFHPRNGRKMLPTPLGGKPFGMTPFDDPRNHLARWMADPKNPFFARTMANRLWGHFLGRGIIDPIDDARSTNPPSNPELLDYLAKEFVDSKFNVKHLIRLICNSYAYRLDAVPHAGNIRDQQTFARFYPRRLSAEVLLDSLSQVLGVPTQFSGGPGTFPKGIRAVQLPDENVPSTFLDMFGRPARTSACECERKDEPALGQALVLVNSPEIQRKLTHKDGFVAKLLKQTKTVDQNLNEIFVRVMARRPSAREQQVARDFIQSEKDKVGAYQSLVWSLLATNEFLFNH